MNGRHIILYTDDYGTGGVAQYNHSLLRGLSKLGFRLSTITYCEDNPLLAEQKSLGIERRWLSYDPGKDFAQSVSNEAESKELISRDVPDLILFSNNCPVSNFAAKRAAIQMGIPFMVVEGFVAEYLAERMAAMLPELGAHYRSARVVISVSHENLGLLHRHFGLPPGKGQVIHYGRPEHFFELRNTETRARVRREISVPDDAVLCLTVGRLTGVKGYELQLEAIMRMKAEPSFERLHFAWVGRGESEENLRQIIARQNLQDRVHLLGQRWDVPDFLDASDIFILPSGMEGMPLAIMEAMAKSLPVIATAVSGIPEELGPTGRLIPDPKIDPLRTVEGLVAAIRELAADQSLRERMGREGHARARELFTEQQMIDRTVRAIAHAQLPPTDYVSPDLEVVRPDAAFPNMAVADARNHPYPYLRREIPHTYYCDARSPVIGFVSRDEASILYNTALRFAGKPALEIGCWRGWSACHLAMGGVLLDVVDPLLTEPGIFDGVRESLTAAGVINRVNLFPGFSPAKVQEIAAAHHRCWELIFIDGDHEHPGPLKDAMACEALAASDALVLFHDLVSPDVASGLEYFRSKGWNTMIYQTKQIVGVAWRGEARPIHHIPDPNVAWTMPSHLTGFAVSGLQTPDASLEFDSRKSSAGNQ